MEEKNNKIIIILVIIIILCILCLVGYVLHIYTSQNEEEEPINYTKLEKYENDENYYVETYLVNDELDTIEIVDANFIDSNSAVINSTYLNQIFIIAISGEKSDKYKKFKNGTANIWFKIDEDGNLGVDFYELLDANNTPYLYKLDEISFTVYIKNEKLIQFAKDDNYLYLLTDKGNLYISEMKALTNTVSFERDLDNLKNKKFDYTIKNKKIEKIRFYFEDYRNRDVGQLYAQLEDKSLINVFSEKKIEEVEKYLKFFRFGNAGLIVTREGYIRFCNSWEGKNGCTEEKMGEVIIDENNKPIIISHLFTTDKSELFVIDNKGNIYREKFDNTNHKVIEKLNKYNDKIVKNIYYVSKDSEPYMLEDLVISYNAYDQEYFGKTSKLDIYSKPYKLVNIVDNEDIEDNETENIPDEVKDGMSFYEDEITYRIIQYDYKPTSKDKFYSSTENFDGLFTLYENKKYDSVFYDDKDNKYSEYIGLFNAKGVISLNDKKYESKIDNIKSLHLMGTCGDDYHGEVAILTNDGDLYISNLCDYSGTGDAKFNARIFEDAIKIESKNKYKDVAKVLQNYKYYEEEYDGDTFNYQFIGITTDDKYDLIGEFVNGELY